MKKTALCVSVVLSLSLAIAMLGGVGCEDSSEDEALLTSLAGPAVSPSSVSFPAATITSVVFTATGGTQPYGWGIQNGNGSLISSGPTAVYTSTTNVGANIVTVTDSDGDTAAAAIQQL